MKRIIRLTESDLTRIVKRVLKEANGDEANYHRYRDGSDPGIEEFFADPLNEELADELQHQLVPDKYAKGALPKTNLGKGTGKMFIFLNNVKMTPDGFIDKVQEDKAGGYCHTIKTYEYNNRVLLATKITITTDIGPCKKKTNSNPNSEPQKKQTKPDGCPVDSSEWYNNVLDMGGTPFNWRKVVPKMTVSKEVACKCFKNNSDSSYYRRLQNQGGRCGFTDKPTTGYTGGQG
jgi:hypothetical protein